jgi:hypothetical protein
MYHHRFPVAAQDGIVAIGLNLEKNQDLKVTAKKNSP